MTLPDRDERDPERVAALRRNRQQGIERLGTLLQTFPAVREFVEDNVRRFNGTPGEPRSFDMLDALLDEQAYRLAFWRVAGEEINYRRFFDVNELAAIRVERPEVFEDDPPARSSGSWPRRPSARCASTVPTGSTRPQPTTSRRLRASSGGGRCAVSSPRRSWRRGSGCPPPGRSTARPATSS